MNDKSILQISTADQSGGAERVAWSLFQAYRQRGLQSWLAVGRKHSNNPDVYMIPNDAHRSAWTRFWRAIGNRLTPYVSDVRGAWQLRTLLYGIGQPRWWLDIRRGYEDFNYPGTRELLSILPQHPDIVHCHNLHGEFFDLRVLPWLNQQLPVILTLHDAWLLSGHCAHSFDCERWKTGCGNCPDLTIPPAIQRDKTAYNWQRKQLIFSQSRLYVATPSRWLMQKVEQSMLTQGIIGTRTIPNGIDLSIFQSANRVAVRTKLGIPRNAKVILFVANTIRRNIWKDYQTMYMAIHQVAEHLPDLNVLFIALGEKALTKQIGRAVVRFIPYQKDPKDVARYYQAADIYLHAARIDNFPTTVLEALASGLPVIATAVGGIPEQIRSLKLEGSSLDVKSYPPNKATGILVPAQDAQQMAIAIEWLASDETLSRQLGKNAASDARDRFNLDRQVDEYLKWYEEIIFQEKVVQT